MSQVLASLEISDPPENNDPPKKEALKLISLLKYNGYDRYPEQTLHWSERDDPLKVAKEEGC